MAVPTFNICHCFEGAWTLFHLMVNAHAATIWLVTALLSKTLLVLAVVYSLVSTPLEFAFFLGEAKGRYGWVIATSIASSITGINGFMHFWISLNHSEWLKLSISIGELATAIPFGVIAAKNPILSFLMWFVWLRVVILCRLFNKFQNDIDLYLKQKEYTLLLFCVRFLKILALDFYWFHICACFSYYLATKHPTNSWYSLSDPNFLQLPMFKRYTEAIYFSFVSITTIGYGDDHPVNPLEKWVIIVMMILSGFVAVVSGHMFTNLMTKYLKMRRQARNQDGQVQQGRQIELLAGEQLQVQGEGGHVQVIIKLGEGGHVEVLEGGG